MKRHRSEADMVASEIRSAIQELSTWAVNAKNYTKLTDDDDDSCNHGHGVHNNLTISSVHHHQLPSKPFLSLCNILIQVLDKIGPTMAVLRQDIHQNIQRLEMLHDSNPSIYWNLVEMLKKEVNEGKAKKGPTCSKAFVWLTRSLDFTLVLLQLLVKDFDKINMEQAVEESYNMTLKPWHGWISSAAYRVALKLVPDGQTLISIMKAEDEDSDMLREEVQRLISLLVPVLQQNNEILRTYGLDKLKST